MTTRRLIPREQAEQDIDATIDHYLLEAGDRTASGFLDAVRATFRQISDHPEAGSPQLGQSLRISGLRTWKLKTYPYLIIYIVAETEIDVWRLLHVGRDIPGRLSDLD
ncbi:type II toxin-antitoxin system RelE/ParE family toxin [Brevundimonas staleyi]|uniref:Type II toxin-antitoxin system RelE/ParE family toxin n=1 Tax=Brevundimonas staleyi TaxID=74326 RepID=A0ABW0FPK7_9CAUL